MIGPADSSNPVNDATYSPLNAGGDRQLVIGSGTEFWIRGDQNFDVTLNNDVTVNNSLTVKGDFVVNGVTTTVQSNTLEIADKNIELAKVSSTQFTCTTTDGSAAISSISPTLGLIPGMVVTSNTAGVSVPGGTTIASITGNNATLSNNVTGSGTPTFSAIGPSDTAADGGGIILKGSPSDHTFTWSNANDAWQSSEDMELVNGKTYNIIDGAGNAQQVLSLTQVGPSSGTASLGNGVTSSVLTSVGTLTVLEVSGNLTMSGTGYLQLPSGTDSERPGSGVAAEGMLRWNDTSNVFEGYDGNVWGKIGGGAAVQSAAPSSANSGDLWYDTDDGRMFVYYDEGSSGSAQWVDASPNGLPTDLTLDGTLTVDGTSTFNSSASFVSTNTSSRFLGFYQNTSVLKAFIEKNGNNLTIFNQDAGDLTLANGGSTRLRIDSNGHTLPHVDNTHNLGAPTNRWANIYSADLQLSNEGAVNEVDGTWGQYTIQEGQDDLFLINRRSGKKYKFMLQEVN